MKSFWESSKNRWIFSRKIWTRCAASGSWTDVHNRVDNRMDFILIAVETPLPPLFKHFLKDL
uniref:Uncharacterized protein n=1 Tax=Megaselia scalaris TaxID=36166 RepID=T1GBK1_MEGSC